MSDEFSEHEPTDAQQTPVDVPDDLSGLDDTPAQPDPQQAGQQGAASDAEGDEVAQYRALAAERTADLQRLQAEYVNYKRRVDRDRDLARATGTEKVLLEMLPILDAVAMADSHGELTGGFKMVADELQKISAKHGLVAFGAVGDEFDPHRHEALMHQPLPGATITCVSAVMQQGYQLGERVLRPARVAVSDPDPDAAQN